MNNQGNNSYAFLKYLVYSNGRMTDSINKKLHAHDKMLENINAKLDEFLLVYLTYTDKSASARIPL